MTTLADDGDERITLRGDDAYVDSHGRFHTLEPAALTDQQAEELAYRAGLRTEFAGAASAVWSDGCNCVTFRDLHALLAEHAKWLATLASPPVEAVVPSEPAIEALRRLREGSECAASRREAA
jgi:hypothetical protein